MSLCPSCGQNHATQAAVGAPFAMSHAAFKSPHVNYVWTFPDQQHLPLAVAARAWFHVSTPTAVSPAQAASSLPQGLRPPPVTELIDGVQWQFAWRANPMGQSYLVALQWAPAKDDVHEYLGSAYAQRGDEDRAERSFRRVIALSPGRRAFRRVGQ